MFGVKCSSAGYVSISGVGRKNKNKKWKLRCDSNFWKSLAVEKGTSTCGNPAGTVHVSTRTSKVRIRAVRDARRTTSDARWMSISQRTIEMGTYHWEGTGICKHPFEWNPTESPCTHAWCYMVLHGARILLEFLGLPWIALEAKAGTLHDLTLPHPPHIQCLEMDSY